MSVAQPVPRAAALESPFGAMVTRQLSMWPFAARVARLFLVVDPSLADQTLRNGLLRAMQQAYFGSDGYSQTRAVREAALAAHYVLRHHNRDVLPMDQINAASAVAAMRGDVAFVALAGDAAAFAWRRRRAHRTTRHPAASTSAGPRTGPRHHAVADVAATLAIAWPWCAAQPGGQIRSARSRRSCSRGHFNRGRRGAPGRSVERHAGRRHPGRGTRVSQPARAAPAAASPGREQAVSTRHVDAAAAPPQPLRRRLSPARWIVPVLGLVLLAMMALATFAILPPPGTPPTRIRGVSPRTAIRLGPEAASVVDLAVGDDALYTLDVAEGAVRAFSLDALRAATDTRNVAGACGTSIDALGGQLALPVAIEYLTGPPLSRARWRSSISRAP